MSNDLTKDIKKVDTAAVIDASSFLIGKIVWTEATAADQLTILDASGGKILFKGKCGLTNETVIFDFNGYSSKMEVTVIGGGLLLIHPYLPAR